MKDWVDSKFVDLLLDKLKKEITKADSPQHQQKIVVVSEKVPLSPKGYLVLMKKAHCVFQFLRVMKQRYLDGKPVYVGQISEEVSDSYVEKVWPRAIH